MTMTISEHVSRFVAMKQKLGSRFVRSGQVLHSFASVAEARNETFVRSETAIEWVSAPATASRSERVRKLRAVHDLGSWLYAEDDRHEIPPPHALGRLNERRPRPCLMPAPDIGKLLMAALSMGPTAPIVPLT